MANKETGGGPVRPGGRAMQRGEQAATDTAVMPEGGFSIQDTLNNTSTTPAPTPVDAVPDASQSNAQEGNPGGNPLPPMPPTSTPETGPVSVSGDMGDLLGPSLFPNEAITAGLNRSLPGRVNPPPNFQQNFAPLVEIAKHPDAAPELINLVRLVTYYLTKGQ